MLNHNLMEGQNDRLFISLIQYVAWKLGDKLN